MANKTIGSCASCDYPLVANHIGEEVTCPMCNSINESISQEVTIPRPVLIGVIAFLVGVFVGPALIATTSEGQKWLEKQARGG